MVLIVVFSFLDFPSCHLKCLCFLWNWKGEELEKIGQQPTGWALAHGNDGTNCRLSFPGFSPPVTVIPAMSAFALGQEKRGTRKDWPAAHWMDIGSQQQKN
jgi:hypothetical protein